ncbi:MAG: trehalose-6-phosphate synthase, partial [Hyphomicrobiales bacterium]
EGVAAALKRALDMPLEERRRRQSKMFEHLAKYDIERWAKSYLSTLADTRQRPGLFDGLRTLFGSLA